MARWFERAPAHETRDRLWPDGDRRPHPHALQPLQPRQRAGLIGDPELGQGRDPLAPLQDGITDEGDIVVSADPRYLGLWLTGLFGDPDTIDNHDGSWDYEFASGGDDLSSYTLEVGMPKAPAFFRHAGAKLNSRSGPAAATISAIAQGETRFDTTRAAHRPA
jgi:hypothetical protein